MTLKVQVSWISQTANQPAKLLATAKTNICERLDDITLENMKFRLIKFQTDKLRITAKKW